MLRGLAPDTAAFDACAERWFVGVAVPEYELSDVTRAPEGEERVVRGTVENVRGPTARRPPALRRCCRAPPARSTS